MTRREFIAAGAAFGSMGPGFAVSAGTAATGVPALRLGVLSDVHFLADPKPWRLRADWDEGPLVHALRYFRDRKVDAVVIAGDLADSGYVFELEAVAKAWWSVFPGDKAPDGRRVERLFVYGNHDIEGHLYGGEDRLKKACPDEAEYKPMLIATDRAAAWQKAFHEPFELIWKKTVKGFLFIGAHWIDANGIYTLPEFYRRESASFPKDRPFFYIQHAHLRDTCYGDWAWGHDNGKSTQLFSAHPNLVTISGHSHYSLTDDRSVWQGAFTSFGASSLRYSGQPYNEFADGFENTVSEGRLRAREIDAAKMMPVFYGYGIRQGMVMSVYDDRIVAERRDFVGDQPLGPDWVVPLPAKRDGSFSLAGRRAAASAPQFPAGAEIKVVRCVRETRGKVAKPSVAIQFPPANAGTSRVYHYEVAVIGPGGDELSFKRVLSPGWSAGKGSERYLKPCPCVFAEDELPRGDFVFEVRPIGWLGTKGRPLNLKVTSKKGQT